MLYKQFLDKRSERGLVERLRILFGTLSGTPRKSAFSSSASRLKGNGSLDITKKIKDRSVVKQKQDLD